MVIADLLIITEHLEEAEKPICQPRTKEISSYVTKSSLLLYEEP